LNELDKKNSFFSAVTPWKSTFLENLSYVIGHRNQKEQINALLKTISKPSLSVTTDWGLACVKGLIKGQEKVEGLDDALKEKLKSIESASKSNIKKAIGDLKQLYL
jgi:hypothetical protein